MRTIAAIMLVLCAMTTRVEAFCGFYVGGAGTKMFNNATQVVLMRHGQTTVLSMQNNYQGPPSRFAMVIPVPVVLKEQQVKTLPHDVFDKIDQLGAPRLVEYWEADPCNPQPPYELTGASLPGSVETTSMSDDESDEEEYKVKIEAKFSVGEYDIVVLSASESTGLEKWLRKNEYAIPDDVAPLLRPYIEQGMKFFVAKVDPKKVVFTNGNATLSPLRFHYDSPDFSLPIRLGVANSNGAQDLIVNILAPNLRYEVANYPNVTIPTNLVLKPDAKDRFAEFYVSLFDHAVGQVPNAVVTEYAWDASSCDPCPGPVLDMNDLATFGGDVISSTYKDASVGMTLTRLHARYGKEVSRDLVFRAVQGIAGGRGTPDQTGRLETAVTHEGYNNFQGRYSILHPWTGPVACDDPKRGIWGGPPGQSQQIAAKPGKNLAFAPRGKIELAAMLASAPPAVGAMASTVQLPPSVVRQPRGCGGCHVTGGASAGAFALLLGFVLRRRRRA